MLAGGECTLFTRHSRVQQLGSAHLSGPTRFAHGQRTICNSYNTNKVMLKKIINGIRLIITGEPHQERLL